MKNKPNLFKLTTCSDNATKLSLFLIFGLSLLLLFGCLAPNKSPLKNSSTEPFDSNLTQIDDSGLVDQDNSQDSSDCTFSSTFSEPKNLRLSHSTSLVGTVTCAKNQIFVLNLDGLDVSRKTISSNSPTPLEFNFYPSSDGLVKISVLSLNSNASIFSRSLNVSPLGESRTIGKDLDDFSFKTYLAYSFEVKNPISVDKIKAYLRRRDSSVQDVTQIEIQLRPDQTGNPSPNSIASSNRSIHDLGLDDKWLTFNFQSNPTLNPGKYWAVLKIAENPEIRVISDTIGIRTIYGDKDLEGNSYTRVMKLDVDTSGVAHETSWTPLPFDRTYAITIHSEN